MATMFDRAEALMAERRTTNQHVTAFEREVLGDIGLTFPQFEVMLKIRLGPKAMGEVAEELGITGGSMTQVTDNIERAGLAFRERSTEDRRVITIALTAKGKEYIERFSTEAA